MTPEEHLIQRYFNAFNRHDIEGVMTCFHDHPLVIDAQGHHFAGQEAVRRYYETSFALFPDGWCDLCLFTGHDGQGVEESFFHGTRPREGKVVEALGAEVVEIIGGKIKKLHDYHRPVSTKTAYR